MINPCEKNHIFYARINSCEKNEFFVTRKAFRRVFTVRGTRAVRRIRRKLPECSPDRAE